MRKEERPLGARTGTARIKVLNHSLQPNCRKTAETGVTCRVAEALKILLSILNLGNFKCVLNKDGFFHQLCENAQEGIPLLSTFPQDVWIGHISTRIGPYLQEAGVTVY